MIYVSHNFLFVFCIFVATWLSIEGVAINNLESGDVTSDQVVINRAPHGVEVVS